jgi:hypothetical protein
MLVFKKQKTIKKFLRMLELPIFLNSIGFGDGAKRLGDGSHSLLFKKEGSSFLTMVFTMKQ